MALEAAFACHASAMRISYPVRLESVTPIGPEMV